MIIKINIFNYFINKIIIQGDRKANDYFNVLIIEGKFRLNIVKYMDIVVFSSILIDMRLSRSVIS